MNTKSRPVPSGASCIDHRTPEELATHRRMTHWTFPAARSEEWKRAYEGALDYVGNTPAGKAHAARWADYAAGGAK